MAGLYAPLAREALGAGISASDLQIFGSLVARRPGGIAASGEARGSQRLDGRQPLPAMQRSHGHACPQAQVQGDTS